MDSTTLSQLRSWRTIQQRLLNTYVSKYCERVWINQKRSKDPSFIMFLKKIGTISPLNYKRKRVFPSNCAHNGTPKMIAHLRFRDPKNNMKTISSWEQFFIPNYIMELIFEWRIFLDEKSRRMISSCTEFHL